MSEQLPSVVNVVCDEIIEQYAPELLKAAKTGISDVTSMMSSRLHTRVIGSRWGAGDYESTKWFVDRAYVSPETAQRLGPRNENLADKVIYDVMKHDIVDDPYRRVAPHLGYMLLSRNLTARNGQAGFMNFVFGVTNKGLGQSIQSIYKYIEAGLDSDVLARATRLVARHEFGHLIGLDTESIANQDRRGGALYDGHCVNECTMQQIVSVSEAVEQSAKLAHKTNAGFCSDCTGFIRNR